MALFLTRLLAADGIVGSRRVPRDGHPDRHGDPAAGNGRAYTATFKNADGTPYTGPVGITLRGVCDECN